MRHLTRLSLIALAALTLGCPQQEQAERGAPEATASAAASGDVYVPEVVTPAEAKARMDRGEKVVVADVRSERSFQREHIAGAVSLPVVALSKEQAPGLPKDSWILLYCT